MTPEPLSSGALSLLHDAGNLPPAAPLRVLLADDHPLILEGLETCFRRRGLDVVGRLTEVRELLPQCTALKPDVVVLDLRFAGDRCGGGAAGLEAAQRLLEQAPQSRIVFYTQFEQDEILRAAYDSGCQGFVLKSQPADVLADAVHKVHAGTKHYMPAIAERLAELSLQRRPSSPLAQLTERQVDVFRRTALGETIAEIALALGLSTKTIGAELQRVKEILGVDRTADLTRAAVRLNVIQA